MSELMGTKVDPIANQSRRRAVEWRIMVAVPCAPLVTYRAAADCMTRALVAADAIREVDGGECVTVCQRDVNCR
jgi:hypothetical protein